MPGQTPDRAITEIAVRYRIGESHYEITMSPEAVDALLLSHEALDSFHPPHNPDRDRQPWDPEFAPYIRTPVPIPPVGGLHELALNGDDIPCAHIKKPRYCSIVCMGAAGWLDRDFYLRRPFTIPEYDASQ